MNWITTNIRLPEEYYMNLKLEAAKKRKSVASLMREKLRISEKQLKNKNYTKKLLAEFKKVAKETARQNRGLNSTKAIIEMRYEQ